MSTIYPRGTVVLAPLSGFTDLPYRRSARRHACRFAFTEMIDAGSLVFGNAKTCRFLDRGDGENWLGAQLIGSDPATLAVATEIVNRYNFDILDFNLGCPAPKVARKGEGAVLAEDADRALAAFEAVARKSRFPATVKLRILDADNPAPTVSLCQRLVAAGAAAITIHGRVRRAFYSGPVAAEIIAAVRAEVPVQVVANGGVVDAATCRELRGRSGCDVVMVATGAMGNPWLFRELAEPADFAPPSPEQLADEMAAHLFDMIEYHGESLALRIGRKIILDYLRGRGYPGALKARVSQLDDIDTLREFIDIVRAGPGRRYLAWLRAHPDSPRRLSVR